VNYRLYAPNDFAALYAIEEACFEPPFRFGRSFMRELVDRSDGATWIAEENGRMAGFAIAGWSQEEEGMTAYIQTIEVVPEWRGGGVGSGLMRQIEDSARAAGAETIWLHVDTENDVAIRLYEGHGYLHEGRDEDFYARGRAALVFAKELRAGVAS